MSKNGFSYYKAETDRFQDIKIKRLKKKYGCDGYAVYQYALNEIYRVEGAYIRWTEDQLFDCADYWDMNEARVKEIIGYCAEVCLFDPVMWKTQCILTSRAIQSRYLDICKISKKKSYIPLEILLVEPEQPMREPVAMPLFEGGAGAAEHDTPNQATLAEQKFRSTPETFQNTQESSGNIPEKTDKEKKIKEKQNKENSSSTPRSLPERLRRRKREFYFLLPYWVRTVAPNRISPGINRHRRMRRRRKRNSAIRRG